MHIYTISSKYIYFLEARFNSRNYLLFKEPKVPLINIPKTLTNNNSNVEINKFFYFKF